MSVNSNTAYLRLAGATGVISEAIVKLASTYAGTALTTPVAQAELAFINYLTGGNYKVLQEARYAYAKSLGYNSFDEIPESSFALPSINPIVLPSGASSVYSLAKVSGYSGPCLRVRRASDAAEQDIGFNANNFMDVAAAQTFKGASTLTVTTWYDQTGNANHATQTVVANQPFLNTEYALYGYYGIYFGDIADVFAGTKRYFDMPATLAYNSQSFTGLTMMAPHSSGNIHAISQHGPDAGSIFISLFNRNNSVRPGLFLASTGGFAVIAPTPGPLYSDFTFAGIRGTGTNKSIFGTVHNGDSGIYTSNGAAAAGTGAGGHIGFSFGASASMRGSMYAYAVYPTNLSDSDVALAKAEFNRVWNPAATTKSYVLVYDGDSITEGFGATFQRNRTRKTLEALNNKAIAYYNLGVSGTSANTVNNNKTQALPYQAPDAVAGKKAVVLLAGINDIRAGTPPTPATIWTNYISAYVTYAIGLGYSVAVGTLIRNTGLTTQQETDRQALNTLIRNGVAGLGAVLIDYDADGTNVTLMDGTHPDNNGYAVMSARELPVIRSMLGL